MVAIGPGALERMMRTNLEGARNVVGQAVEAGVERVVHVSSVAAVFAPGLTQLTGELPVADGLDDYGASKAAVERYVRGLQDEGAPIDITYPGMVLGPPAGEQVGESTTAITAVLRLRSIPGRRASWTICDVRDLGEVHAALVRKGAPAGRWAAGGVRLEVGDVARTLSSAAGRRIVPVPVPDSLLLLAGRGNDLLRLRTPLTRAAMEYYTRMPPSDNEPVERELGVTFRDPRETLGDTVAGLRAIGRLTGG
jgi:dihydroflavonol-4-reductase